MECKAIVIGSSAGGLEGLRTILSKLPGSFPVPIIIVQHLSPNSDSYLVEYLKRYCRLLVLEAEEKEEICAGFVYTAPSNYHLMIEKDGSFSFSVDQRVSFARPSIDVLFETAADAFGKSVTGIILTGANHDGSYGLQKIKEHGGLTIVQNPETAEVDTMPRSALRLTKADYVLDLECIADFLLDKFRNC